jgi:UPF0288 family protein (methanogenesis marker protein 3)
MESGKIYRLCGCDNISHYISQTEDGAACSHTKEEYVKQKRREWLDKNKEKINARAYGRVTCECGEEVQRGKILRHKRTTKHKKKIAAQVILKFLRSKK